MRTFSCTIDVRFAETDAFGIVYYPNIFHYFDLAVETILRASPYDHFGNLRATGAGFPALECAGAFSSPIFAGDRITIETDVEDVRTRAFRVRHRIARGEETLATGYEVRMYAHRPPGSTAIEGLPLPSALRAWLAGIEPVPALGSEPADG